jgi:hypothetical protein
MASTVIAAFEEFLSDPVNLDPGVTDTARASRDWLVGQIHTLPANHADFPALYQGFSLFYGSFNRRTKIRELDDVDLIIGINALGTTYLDFGGSIQLTVPEGIALRAFCHENTNLLNSRRVINKFVQQLPEIPQYEKADLKRNGSAAVLKLKSYSWSFDIVPGFFTTPEADGRTFYIIPDGNGHWMKTDPRIDQERISALNQAHGGNVLNPLRLTKYWNRRPTMPSIPPYVLECMVLDYYQTKTIAASGFPDVELGQILSYVATAIHGLVADPKRIQGDLNSVPVLERFAISARASTDAQKVAAARAAEDAKDYKKSFAIWNEILGPAFPTFN